MSENLRAETDQLRSQVEDLAMQLVLGSNWDTPEALRGLSESLAGIREQAEAAGWQEVAALARELAEPLDGGGAAADPASLEETFKHGVARLQAALEKGPVAADSAAQNGWQANLSQDPDLLRDVVLESREHLTNVESRLLTLEQDPGDAEAIHSAFRSFHTIKGLAGFMELTLVQEVAHDVETVLDLARNSQLAITPAVTDVVLESVDYLKRAMGQLDAVLAGGPAEAFQDNRALLEKIRRAATAAPEEAAAATPEEAAPSAPPVEPAADQAASPKVEEPAAAAAAEAAPDDGGQKTVQRRSEAATVKVDTAKLDYLVDMAGEMVIAQSLVRHDPHLTAVESQRLQRNMAQLTRITSELQKTAMALRMVPIGQVFRRVPRLVRDLSRKAGKQVELELAGEETELDRTIVEELGDPLVHMVRNTLDHGIEPPQERLAAGKPAAGKLTLRARHQAAHILIEVADDGRGINRQKVLAKAIEKGLVREDAHLSDTEVFNLIFEPGFSTADRVTEVSGRGVGMDVVRRQIQKLRGRVEIQSEPGRGTTLLLKLPLTLAIIDGLVVGVGGERYIVPLFSVREMFRPTAEMISTVQGRREMVMVREKLLPVMRLHRRFGVEPRSEDPCDSIFILAENEGRPYCLMVDEFVGKQEVVIKSLGESLKHVPGIAGGAILGDGRVGLVLDMDGVFLRGANA